MDGPSVDRAFSAYATAERAIDDIRHAEAFPDSERAWSEFLTHCNRVYRRLELASHGHPNSENWFRTIKTFRTSDPLLCYLKQARNADDHSIHIVKPNAECKSVTPPVITEPGPATVEITVQYSIEGFLVPVTNRGVVFDVPSEHNGVPLMDSKPTTVGTIALQYLGTVLAEARDRIATS